MSHTSAAHKPVVRQVIPLHKLGIAPNNAEKPKPKPEAAAAASAHLAASSVRSGLNFGASLCSMDPGHPSFREPLNDEWVIGLYREKDGTTSPILLWADPKVDLLWDPSARTHVNPPGSYLLLPRQPKIDGRTGHPIIDGAVCPY
jgi:hypothetical protein